MKNKMLTQLKAIFQTCPEVKLVYFFGSQITGKSGPLSDYDFAVYLDTKDTKKMFDIKCDLQDKISRTLKSDKVDIVVINLTKSPELKYNIIKEGSLIFEREPFKVLIEPRILNEYFDFHALLVKHGLTKA